MKSAAEWIDEHYGTLAMADPELIAAIQSDARADMVPKGEVASAVAVQHSLQARLDEETTWAAKWKKERDEARAELAKAWEAGRDAAWRAMATCNDKTHAEELRAISKLQPPGGKAK